MTPTSSTSSATTARNSPRRNSSIPTSSRSAGPTARLTTVVVRVGYYCIDTFTPLSRDAYKAARAAVNVALSGASAIVAGEPLVYSLCRPARPPRRARHLRRLLLLLQRRDRRRIPPVKLGGRVAILDVDYHHGNGAQDIFWERSDVLTVSIHGHPNFAYPYFSGFADETGEGRRARGSTATSPCPKTSTTAATSKNSTRPSPSIRKFDPVALVVSLGLDIAKADPTGTWSRDPRRPLSEVGRRIGALKYPTLLVQEGGYNIRFLGRNAARMLTGVCAGALDRRARPKK